MRGIYIDVLFAANFIIDYLILLSCAKFLHIHFKRRRLALAAFLGGAYAVAAVAIPPPGYSGSLLMLLMACVIVKAAFPCKTRRLYLKQVTCFFVLSFLFSGAVSFLYFWAGAKILILPGGAFYFDSSIASLFFYFAVCYGILTLFQIIRGRGSHDSQKSMRILIERGGKNEELNVLIDSGHTLHSVSGLPVILVEEKMTNGLLEGHELAFLKGERESPPDGFNISYVPYRTVSGDGVIPCFKPDKVFKIEGKRKTEIASCLIGMSANSISSDGRFCGLIGEFALY